MRFTTASSLLAAALVLLRLFAAAVPSALADDADEFAPTAEMNPTGVQEHKQEKRNIIFTPDNDVEGSTRFEPPCAFEKCGNSVDVTCKTTTVPMTVAGWKALTDQAIGVITILLKGPQAGTGNSDKYDLCFFRRVIPELLSSIWYLSLDLGLEQEVIKYVAEYYPYICTCAIEVSQCAAPTPVLCDPSKSPKSSKVGSKAKAF